MVEKLAGTARARNIGLGRLAAAYGILYDKARLERDESTANVMSVIDWCAQRMKSRNNSRLDSPGYRA